MFWFGLLVVSGLLSRVKWVVSALDSVFFGAANVLIGRNPDSDSERLVSQYPARGVRSNWIGSLHI